MRDSRWFRVFKRYILKESYVVWKQRIIGLIKLINEELNGLKFVKPSFLITEVISVYLKCKVNLVWSTRYIISAISFWHLRNVEIFPKSSLSFLYVMINKMIPSSIGKTLLPGWPSNPLFCYKLLKFSSFHLKVEGKVNSCQGISWNRAMDEVRIERLMAKYGRDILLIIIRDWPACEKYKDKPELVASLEYLVCMIINRRFRFL